MSFAMILTTVLEWAVGLFLIWGFFNEDKLVAFEDRLVSAVKGLVGRKRPVRKICR